MAEWAGLKVWVMPQTEDEVICVHPDDPDSCLAVDFTASLDDCFRWLMPKIYANVERNKNPALALCRAIEQIIDKEKAN